MAFTVIQAGPEMRVNTHTSLKSREVECYSTG